MALREAAWVARCVGRAEVAPLGEEDVAALAGYLVHRQAARGGVLFKQGEPQVGVRVLRSDTVELTVANGHRPLVVQVHSCSTRRWAARCASPSGRWRPLLGVHRQALTRALRSFEEDGAVELGYGVISLRDPLRLRTVASR